LLYACRTLFKRPGYELSIVLTLAIGIGATTLMFSLVDAALIRPLPFADSERLVMLTGVAGPRQSPACDPSIAITLERHSPNL
jgi:hypothetical protein